MARGLSHWIRVRGRPRMAEFQRHRYGMHVFQDRLYVGTWNVHTGAQLWRTRAGVIHPLELDDWERVDPNTFSGFAVTSLITFQDELYAGIFTQGFPIFMPAC